MDNAPERDKGPMKVPKICLPRDPGSTQRLGNFTMQFTKHLCTSLAEKQAPEVLFTVHRLHMTTKLNVLVLL